MAGDGFDISRAAGRIRRNQIGTDPAGHENVFNARDAPERGQQIQLRRMRGFQRRANAWEKTVLSGAGAFFLLERTIKAVHVGRWAAHVRNGPAELGMLRKGGDFPNDILGRAADDATALMDGNGAEPAFPVTAAMRRDAETNGVERADRTLRADGRGRITHPLDSVNIIQFVGFKRR